MVRFPPFFIRACLLGAGVLLVSVPTCHAHLPTPLIDFEYEKGDGIRNKICFIAWYVEATPPRLRSAYTERHQDPRQLQDQGQDVVRFIQGRHPQKSRRYFSRDSSHRLERDFLRRW